ncbi:MAG: permease [Candidatus Sumerlaeaceae bacterium]|nr:permease [Candidatus Sumerlaeaceae bacterium]
MAPFRTLFRQLAVSIEWRALLLIVGLFVAGYFLPVGTARFDGAVLEGLHLVRTYAREHVIMCLVPALFIAGGIGALVRRDSVLRYLGPRAPKPVAYGTASVSGSVLAVCSCTILPLFASIYRAGGGLGPASTFLYAGPAINVMAVILTARVLGMEMGVARATAAIVFSIVIGLMMHAIFRRQGPDGEMPAAAMPQTGPPARPLSQVVICLSALVGILIFASLGEGASGDGCAEGSWPVKWYLTGAAAGVLALALVVWYGARPAVVAGVCAAVAAASMAAPRHPEIAFVVGIAGLGLTMKTGSGDLAVWGRHTWAFTKEIVPPLFAGVFLAGVLLGRPGHEGLIPGVWVERAVGGNSLPACFFASVAGALMYFATCTEVPILQGLMGAGMGKGPALTLLLAGPALSLPGMMVLRGIVGTRKTLVFVALVVIMSTLCGFLFGALG